MLENRIDALEGRIHNLERALAASLLRSRLAECCKEEAEDVVRNDKPIEISFHAGLLGFHVVVRESFRAPMSLPVPQETKPKNEWTLPEKKETP